MKKLIFKYGKYNFAMDVSALTDYIKAPSEMGDIISVLRAGSIFDRVMVMDNVKSKAWIPDFSTNAALQEKVGCVTTPSGTTTPSEYELEVKPVYTAEEYCNEGLVGTWLESFLKKGLVGQNEVPEPAEVLRALHLVNWRTKAERLWWNGDTTSLNAELNILDGYYTKAEADPLTAKLTAVTISATNAWATFMALVALIPQEALDKGVQYEVRTSRTNASLLLSQIWNDKDYNGLVQGVNMMDQTLDFVMPVTGIRIVSDPNLANDQLIAVPLQNTWLGTDAESDFDFVDARHDPYTEQSKIVVEGRVGAGYSKPQYIVVMPR